MASLETLHGFSVRADGIRSCTPNHGDISEPTIQGYSPDPSTGIGHLLGMSFVQKNSADPYSWVMKYTTFGNSWGAPTGPLRKVMEAMEFDYDTVRQCLYCTNLGTTATQFGGQWEIEEFLLAQVRSKNLVASITWRKAVAAGAAAGIKGDTYRTAYTWPDC